MTRIQKNNPVSRFRLVSGLIRISLFFVFFCCVLSANGSREIKVGVNANMKPFQFVNSDGELSGLHIDLFDKLAEKKGWDVYYILFDDNEKSYEALANGEIDLIIGNRIGNTRTSDFLDSDELSKSSICIISKKNDTLPDNHASIAAVEFGTVNFYTLYQLGIKSYFVCRDQNQIYNSITEGSLSVAVGVEDMLMYRLMEDGLADDYTIQKHFLASINYDLLAKKGEFELISSVNSGLSELRTSGDYEKIYNNWVQNYDLIRTRRVIRQVLFIGVLVAGIITIYIVINRRLNKALKKKVDEKTRELHDANLQLADKLQQIENDSLLRNQIINNSPNAIIIFDMSGKILISNKPAHVLSCCEENLNGTNIATLSIFNEIISKECAGSPYETIQNTSAPLLYETMSRGKSEDFRYSIFKMETAEKIPAIMITISDITKEEQERQQAFETEKNRQLNRLVAGIAHEIKNPLSTIKTATSLMITQEDDPEVKEAFREMVPAEIDRIISLVDGLKNYAKPVKGNAEMFSLTDTLDGCIKLAQISVVRAKGIIINKVDRDLMLYGRKDQLTQCFMNLILNGAEAIERKYTSADSEITIKPKLIIKASASNGSITILISDEGIGMSDIELEHCIDPFYTTKAVGTGLGLNMTFQFTKDNGGTFDIHSEKGVGTEVKLVFPEAVQ